MNRDGLLKAVVVALDLAAIVLGLLGAHRAWVWWRPHLELVLHVQWWELWLPNPFMPSAAVLTIVWVVLMRQAGLYDPGRMTSSVRMAVAVTRTSGVVLIVVMLLQFLLPDRTYSRFLILAFCGASALMLLVQRVAFFQLQRLVPRPITQSRVAIVGVGPDAPQMNRRLRRHGHHRFAVMGYIACTGEDRDQGVPEDRVLGHVSELAELVNTHDLRVLILCARGVPREEALELAIRADQMGLRVLQVPFSWGVASPRVEVAPMGDLQLIDLTTLAYPTLAEQVKRLVDIVLVLAGGLLLVPLLLCIAALIKLSDGGPVLFVQQRAGRGGRTFPFLKFRSMVVGAEAQRAELAAENEAEGVLFKLSDDPRVTRVGRFIRKTSIDELPQLWNVLRGDMNLVGPRPLPMRDFDALGDSPEDRYWYELRHKVKPGITGPWQVGGRSELGFREMVQLDIEYIQNWSLWLDLVLLAKTAPAVLRGRGAH